MLNDVLAIAVYAAEQLIKETNEMEITFVITEFGPIVQIG